MRSAIVAIIAAGTAFAACSGSGTTWACTAGTTIAQVNSTLSSASDGATLTFASGSYSWGTSLSFSISKGATLICETPLGCVVSGATLWQWANWGTTNKLYRISGFDFTSPGAYFLWLYGTGSSTATLTQLRFDHNRLTRATGATDVIAFGETTGANTLVHGVIDHNTFRTTSGHSRWIVNYAQSDTTWPASSAGTVNNLFIEDNTFNDQCLTNSGNAALDTDGGKIPWVVRYNTFTNARIEHHGYYWSFQGPSSSEVYGNSITMTCGADVLDGTYSIKHQGSGEWYVFNNTVTPSSGKGNPHIPQNYRSFYDNSAPGQCDGTDSEDGNRTPLATYRGYPCNRQPGRDGSGTLKPQYYWNNKWSDNTAISLNVSCPTQAVPNYCPQHLVENRDYYQGGVVAQTSASSPFNGTVGTGFGTLARRPTTCTPTSEALDAGNGGVGYFATDQGAQGTLYRCSATNTWTVAYTPYTYPHPLAATGGTAPTITTTTLPNGTVGTPYNATLAYTGGDAPTWAVTVGSLPSGLNLNSSTGAIAGAPSTAGTSSFTVTATNATGSDTQALSITINAAPSGASQHRVSGSARAAGSARLQ